MKKSVSVNSAHIVLFVVLGLGVALIGFMDEGSSHSPEFAELSHLKSGAVE
ncbi:hypothetical protein [Pseudophaeobacter arcticus]|jgi:hypothetical protein|uniref:hypothetical protein n=1 Tax=Pseudophaeobacter arcticus TaxID=385492 RepID=UPI000424809A|nr:hypothetical protein [Pseudophaeobacter arcticus]